MHAAHAPRRDGAWGDPTPWNENRTLKSSSRFGMVESTCADVCRRTRRTKNGAALHFLEAACKLGQKARKFRRCVGGHEGFAEPMRSIVLTDGKPVAAGSAMPHPFRTTAAGPRMPFVEAAQTAIPYRALRSSYPFTPKQGAKPLPVKLLDSLIMKSENEEGSLLISGEAEAHLLFLQRPYRRTRRPAESQGRFSFKDGCMRCS